MKKENNFIKTLCGICPAGCGLEVLVEDGRVKKIRPDRDHPFGILCPRGAAANEIVHSPDRLLYPVKREGVKGEAKFKRISWDMALDEITTRIKDIVKRFGAESLAFYTGRGGFDQSLLDMTTPGGYDPIACNLFFPLGSPNAASCTSICYDSHAVLAPLTTFGRSGESIKPDIENSDTIFVWGTNPATDSPPINLKRVLAAKEKGAYLIVIDPQKNYTARKADEWIPIRPGTDGALALSMINYIIEKDLIDREFVEKWTIGFYELKEYVKGFSPKKIESICWVPADKIIKLAERIARRKATLLTNTGLEYSNCGVQAIRALFILFSIAGNLDVKGGLLFNMPRGYPVNRNILPMPKGKDPIGSDKYPLYVKINRSAQFMEMPRAILEGKPYQVKGLIVLGSSILTSYPQPAIWRNALKSLDLLVVIDRFFTADSFFADYILPGTTGFEIDSYRINLDYNYVELKPKVVEPVGEARNEYIILAQIAKKLGYGDKFPQTEEEMLNFVFNNAKVSLKELKDKNGHCFMQKKEMVYKKYEKGLLRRDRKIGFPTPSSKVEITSSMLKEYGYDPLPVYVEPKEGPIANPDLAKRFPLVLTTGARIQSTFRSQHLNIPKLIKAQKKPNILIHPEDAKKRGIKDGDKVKLKTLRGEVTFFAKVTDRIAKGVFEANMGGGGPLSPLEWQKANINLLTDFYNRDPISGFPVFKALLCEVEKD